MGSSFPGGEMCMESARAAGRRGGKNKSSAAAADNKANRQPQRGLGVAQLEKIRLHNQMMAAYRSSSGGLQADAATTTRPPFASSFQQPYLTNRFEETERGIVAVHYYDGRSLLPYGGSSPPPPSLFAHDVRDSSGHRLGQPPPQPHQQPPPPQHYWMMSDDVSSRSSSHRGSAEELDLELRL